MDYGITSMVCTWRNQNNVKIEIKFVPSSTGGTGNNGYYYDLEIYADDVSYGMMSELFKDVEPIKANKDEPISWWFQSGSPAPNFNFESNTRHYIKVQVWYGLTADKLTPSYTAVKEVSVLTYPQYPTITGHQEMTSRSENYRDVLFYIDQPEQMNGNGLTFYRGYSTDEDSPLSNQKEFSSSSTGITIPGLKPSTTYYVYVYAGNDATEYDDETGRDYYWYRFTTSSQTSPKPVTPVINLIYSEKPTASQYANGGSGRSIYVSVNAITGATKYTWQYYTDDQIAHNVYQQVTTTTNSVTLTSKFILPNTKYNVKCKVTTSGGDSDFSYVQSVVTYAQPPSSVEKCSQLAGKYIIIQLSDDANFDSIVIQATTSLNGNYGTVHDWTLDGKTFITVTPSDTGSRYFKIWFANSTGLYDVDKYLTCQYIASSGGGGETGDIPQKWSWESSNGDASTSQTKQAYDVITNKGNVSLFHHSVWNDLCAKVSEIISYCKKSWNNTYLSYENTRMSNDYTLTAVRYNSLLYNIYIIYNSVSANTIAQPNAVQKGDTVKGTLIIAISDRINSTIDNINGTVEII